MPRSSHPALVSIGASEHHGKEAAIPERQKSSSRRRKPIHLAVPGQGCDRPLEIISSTERSLEVPFYPGSSYRGRGMMRSQNGTVTRAGRFCGVCLHAAVCVRSHINRHLRMSHKRCSSGVREQCGPSHRCLPPLLCSCLQDCCRTTAILIQALNVSQAASQQLMDSLACGFSSSRENLPIEVITVATVLGCCF